LAVPKTWKIKRKKTVFIARPNPGTHSLQYSITVNLVLTEFLGMAKNSKEVNVILSDNNFLVDGVIRKDPKFPVGLFDVIEIPKTKEYFRLNMNKKGHLVMLKISKQDSKIKPCKITGKTNIGKKFQINLYDGKNILTDDSKYKVGDTLLINLPDLGIKENFQFLKKNTIFLTAGKHAGQIGNIEDIKGDTLIFKDSSGNNVETLKKYAYVVGNERPAIQLGEDTTIKVNKRKER